MNVTASKLPGLLARTIRAGIVSMVTSSPGVGKSSIGKQLAKEYGLKVIDIRLSQLDPIDLMGLLSKNEAGTKGGYLPMETFPIEGDPVPAGYNGWLIIFDEFNSAPLSVQAAAYRVILDKEVGQHKIHPKVAMVAFGNNMGDRAIVNRISTALQSRMAHFQLQLSQPDWIKWANQNEIDYRITAYINAKPDALHNFRPDHNDHTFACPRTWEFCSDLVKGTEITMDDIPLMAAVVDEANAREFFAYTKIFNQIHEIDDLIRNPTGLSVPTEPGVLYAIQSKISHFMSESNANALMKYLERMPPEFTITGLRQAIRRDKGVFRSKAVKDWARDHAKELVGDI